MQITGNVYAKTLENAELDGKFIGGETGVDVVTIILPLTYKDVDLSELNYTMRVIDESGAVATQLLTKSTSDVLTLTWNITSDFTQSGMIKPVIVATNVDGSVVLKLVGRDVLVRTDATASATETITPSLAEQYLAQITQGLIEIDDALEAIDGVYAAKTSAEEAQSAAEAAMSAALAAKEGAEDAADASIAAQGLSESARDSAISAKNEAEQAAQTVSGAISTHNTDAGAHADKQTKAITDAGNYYTTDTVDGALQEAGENVKSNTSRIIELENGTTLITEDDTYNLLGIPNLQPNHTFVNMPVSGSFEVDTSGDGLADGLVLFSFGTPTLESDPVVGTKAQKISYTNSAGSARDVGVRGDTPTNSIAAVNGNKIYVSGWVKKTANHTASNNLTIGFREYTSANATVAAGSSSTAMTTEWARFSKLLTVAGGATTAKVVFLAYQSAANGTTSEYLLDGVNVINVTTSFGAGNEPSLSDLDLMVLSKYPTHGYFTGSSVIPYVNYYEGKVLGSAGGIVGMKAPSEFLTSTVVGSLAIPDAGGYFSNDTINPAFQLLGRLNAYAGVNKFIGKISAWLGDSITDEDNLHDASTVYWNVVKNKMQLGSAVSEAWSGSAISKEASYIDKRFTKRYLSLPSNAEIIGILGGVNDFTQNAVYGAITDAASDADGASFYASLKFLIEGLITKYPSGRIFFMTPIPRWSVSQPYGTTNSVEKTLQDYVDAIKIACRFYSIPVCDLFAMSELYPYNSDQRTAFIPDGTHPNAAGHARIAEKIARFMETL